MIRSYSSLLFWLGMTIAASLMLYHTSDKVHALDQQLMTLNTQIDDEQRSLHVLKAEWVYLANPARIEAEAKRHLGLQLTAPHRIAALQNMNGLLPPEGETRAPVQLAEASVPAKSAAPAVTETKPDKPRTRHERVLAALNAGRINDHMTLQHTAAASASTDRIGALIGKLGLHP
jgi:cell division protein FtsL